MSDGEISQREYWAQVESIAKDVTEEARADGDDLYERLLETIDGHEWIIYTYKAEQVMRWTDSTDAIEDAGGFDATGKSWAEIVTAFAFYALMQDVGNHSAYDADPEDEDEDED